MFALILAALASVNVPTLSYALETSADSLPAGRYTIGADTLELYTARPCIVDALLDQSFDSAAAFCADMPAWSSHARMEYNISNVEYLSFGVASLRAGVLTLVQIRRGGSAGDTLTFRASPVVGRPFASMPERVALSIEPKPVATPSKLSTCFENAFSSCFSD